jgi:FtsH-binding integral membrane protein
VRLRLPKLFWFGLALFVLGCGPLLAIIAAAELGLTSDPNPNPIGPGMLAMFTFWPAIALMVMGLVMAFRRRPPSSTQT